MEEAKNRVSVLVGTPAYGNMVHTDYLHSILDFHKHNLPITLMTLGNESLIPRGRNTIISHFYHNPEFTHLFYLDADIYIGAQGLVKLLSHDKDFIGAAVALKGKDVRRNSVYNVGKPIAKEDNGLVETERVGNAIMILNRKVVEALCEDSKTYSSNPHTRGHRSIDTQFDVFGVGVFDGVYDSEDYFICRKARDLGFKVYVDTTVENRHNGNYVFV